MIKTEKKYKPVHSEIAMKRILLNYQAYNPRAAGELDATLEQMRKIARWVKDALSGGREDVTWGIAYDLMKDTPEWMTDG